MRNLGTFSIHNFMNIYMKSKNIDWQDQRVQKTFEKKVER